MEILKTLTTESKLLYTKMLREAELLCTKMIREADYEDYDGSFNMALMNFTKEERGSLSDLKKKGLIDTFCDPDTPGYSWVVFTNLETAQTVKDVLDV